MPDRRRSGNFKLHKMPRATYSLLFYYRMPILSIIFCLGLVCLRIATTKSFFFSFLIWNLFLAIAPYLISQFALFYGISRLTWKFKLPIFIIWLLFLPNAPYLITDLVHLHNTFANWTWFDLFTVFSFATTGLLLGILSLLDLYTILTHSFTKKLANFMIPIVCLLSGYGIYLGRFLRFNSWDVIYKTRTIAHEIITSSTKPYVWLMSFAFGIFMTLLFFFIKWIKEET